MENKLNQLKCWVCGSENNIPFINQKNDVNIKSTDVKITDDRYGKTLPLYKCSDCSFIFAYPLPENIIELYENLEDDNYISTLEPRVKEMKDILKLSLKINPDAKRILDVGAGIGLMVNEAKKIGLDALGIEPSKWLVNQAKEIFNLEIIEGIVPDEKLKNEKFDIIYAVDVIEHLETPVQFLKDLSLMLNENGLLVIATPDCDSFIANKMKEKWWHFRLAHIGYFNHKSMSLAVKNAGLKLIKYEKQVWYLPFGYLYQRLSNYLPIGFMTPLVKKFKKVDNFPVRLKLGDSMIAFIKK
ncbi:MAG TPA: class I SAM-dependent methyltransferase [Ignavibacteria bacterium]|nr:class I SAM-dependent methyltransferase [Ignavibacteria bacterium]